MPPTESAMSLPATLIGGWRRYTRGNQATQVMHFRINDTSQEQHDGVASLEKSATPL